VPEPLAQLPENSPLEPIPLRSKGDNLIGKAIKLHGIWREDLRD
jgi:hypothetical protein